MRLKNRKILVTGATSGIGLATAKLCLEAGAQVALHSLEHVTPPVELNPYDGAFHMLSGDLSKPTVPRELIAAAASSMCGIDGIVNNAADLTRDNLEDLTADKFSEMMQINCLSPVLLIQSAMPHFRAAGPHSSVVNVGSVNAHCGASTLLSYSASKGALQTISRNLGDALGGEVRVNQLNIGWTKTENEHQIQLSEGKTEAWEQSIPKLFAPRGTILTSEEVAHHILFWLSEESAPITGQTYEVEQFPMIGRNNHSLE